MIWCLYTLLCYHHKKSSNQPSITIEYYIIDYASDAVHYIPVTYHWNFEHFIPLYIFHPSSHSLIVWQPLVPCIYESVYTLKSNYNMVMDRNALLNMNDFTAGEQTCKPATKLLAT